MAIPQRSNRVSDTMSLSLLGGTILVLIGGALTLDGAARTWCQVVLLGVVEGVTEFLPISSTGHLLLVSTLLRFEHSVGGTFEIFIQLGAILAVVWFYRYDLAERFRAFPTDASARRFWLVLGIAFLPAAIVGVLLRSWIKAVLFESPIVIATSLLLGGVVLIAIEHWLRRPSQTRTMTDISPVQAIMIGCAQICALVPGVSRSGATMVGGLLVGLDRSTVTAFSFYLAIPTLGAAAIVDLLGSYNQLVRSDLEYLLVGAGISGLVAWLSIGWLLRYVAHHRFTAFGVYRIIAGLIVLILVAFGIV